VSYHAAIATQEGQQTSCVLDDIPWCAYHTENRYDQSGTEYVDVLRIQTSHIIGEWICSSSDLIADGGDDE
jgi:hypothetical protein